MAKSEKQQVMGESREFRVGEHKRNGEVPQGEIGQLAKGYVDTWLRGLPKRAKQQEVDLTGCGVRVTVTMSVERDAPEAEPQPEPVASVQRRTAPTRSTTGERSAE